jgi:hypothetical protein
LTGSEPCWPSYIKRRGRRTSGVRTLSAGMTANWVGQMVDDCSCSFKFGPGAQQWHACSGQDLLVDMRSRSAPAWIRTTITITHTESVSYRAFNGLKWRIGPENRHSYTTRTRTRGSGSSGVKGGTSSLGLPIPRSRREPLAEVAAHAFQGLLTNSSLVAGIDSIRLALDPGAM